MVQAGQIFHLDMFTVTLSLLNIPIALDGVICTGNETSLLECSYKGTNNHDCHHHEDIVLACMGKRSNDFMILTIVCACVFGLFIKAMLIL